MKEGLKERRESRGVTENGLGEGEKMRECFCDTEKKTAKKIKQTHSAEENV